MGLFVWIERLDGFGEDAIDLHSCRRFRVHDASPEEMQEAGSEDSRHYYHMPDPAPDGRWIRNDFGCDYTNHQWNHYREVTPRSVATDMVMNRIELPPQLIPHAPTSSTESLRPRFEDQSLWIGRHQVKRRLNKSSRPYEIMSQFQVAGWPRSMKLAGIDALELPKLCEDLRASLRREHEDPSVPLLQFRKLPGDKIGWDIHPG